MRSGTTGSVTPFAAWRISLSTVFVLTRSTRLMPRMLEPLMVIGSTSDRTPAKSRLIGVVSDKLPLAIFAPIALFVLRGYAILFHVQR